jgi:8-oxo-dGTP pyrophosphatase MutT (NUDIX family)
MTDHTYFSYKKKEINDRQIITCDNPCCCEAEFKLDKDISSPVFHRKTKGYPDKKNSTAGVFIIDYQKKAILLVQSYGKHWGPPKGGKENNETCQETACRELCEETGILLDKNLLNRKICIKGNVFYIVAYNRVRIDISGIQGREISGIGWFSIDCLIKNFHAISDILNTYARYFVEHSNDIIYGKNYHYGGCLESGIPLEIPRRKAFGKTSEKDKRKMITILFDKYLEIIVR